MSRAASTHAVPARPGRHAGTIGSQYARGDVQVARRVVAALGGRYSAGLGIDVDAGGAEVERWFVAATLLGARIPARVAERAFGVLSAAGLARIGQLRHIPSSDLIAPPPGFTGEHDPPFRNRPHVPGEPPGPRTRAAFPPGSPAPGAGSPDPPG
jgi:hypothetical protein